MDVALKEKPDLENADVFSLHVIENTQNTHLVFLIHHLIADAFSVEKIMTLLSEVYNGVSNIPTQSFVAHAKMQDKDTSYWEELLRNPYQAAPTKPSTTDTETHSIPVIILRILLLI